MLTIAGGAVTAAAATTDAAVPAAPDTPMFTIAKWFDNHTAAISITYDSTPNTRWPVDDFVLEQGLVLDYEMVTQKYSSEPLPDWVEHDLTELIPDVVPGRVFDPLGEYRIASSLALTDEGFGFFGHGHWHVNHDVLTYSAAYDSFRLCYAIMERLGLKPVAYGYPRGVGHKAQTQRALADAGFLAGRLAGIPSGHSPYILPDSDTAPANWFYLPALPMESYDFQQCDRCINNTEELVPILDGTLERTAWIILMYHSIGHYEGWGFYRWDDFRSDMQAIAERDFWVAPMNDIVLYIQERENATVEWRHWNRDGETKLIVVTLSDGLDNARFDQPLTLLFTPPPEWAGLPVHITRNGQHIDWIFPDGGTVMFSVLPDGEPYIIKPLTGL